MNTETPVVFDRMSTLGDATRSRLLLVLEEHEVSVSELRTAVQLPQSTVSRHLRILADAGWVTSRAEGTSRYYRMAPPADGEAEALWELVRRDLAEAPWREGDRARLRSVLEARKDRSRIFFSESAGRWDEVRDALYGADAHRLPLFGLLDPDWVVADLGTGTGTLARTLAPFVRRVVGVDRSPEMLEAARARTTELDTRGRVEYREGHLEELPLADGEIDLAVLSLVLHHVPAPERVLEEVARTLRPGGRVVVVDMCPHERVEYREEMGHLWSGFEEERLIGWLEEAGLEGAVARPLPPHPAAEGPLLFVTTARRPDGVRRTQQDGTTRADDDTLETR